MGRVVFGESDLFPGRRSLRVYEEAERTTRSVVSGPILPGEHLQMGAIYTCEHLFHVSFPQGVSTLSPQLTFPSELLPISLYMGGPSDSLRGMGVP